MGFSHKGNRFDFGADSRNIFAGQILVIPLVHNDKFVVRRCCSHKRKFAVRKFIIRILCKSRAVFRHRDNFANRRPTKSNFTTCRNTASWNSNFVKCVLADIIAVDSVFTISIRILTVINAKGVGNNVALFALTFIRKTNITSKENLAVRRTHRFYVYPIEYVKSGNRKRCDLDNKVLV